MRINTKLHRFMRHLDTHLTSFGLIRWGGNDANETKHKSVKLAYRHTNLQQSSLAAQLVSNGYDDNVDNGNTTAMKDTSTYDTIQSIPIAAVTAAVSSTEYQLNLSDSLHDRLTRAKNIQYNGRLNAGRYCLMLRFRTPFHGKLTAATSTSQNSTHTASGIVQLQTFAQTVACTKVTICSTIKESYSASFHAQLRKLPSFSLSAVSPLQKPSLKR